MRTPSLPLVATLIVWSAACGGATPPDNAAPGATTAPATPASGELVLGPEQMAAGGIVVEAVRTERRASAFEMPAVLHLDERRTARVGAIVDGVILESAVGVGVRVGRGATLAELRSHVVHDAWADYRRALADQRRAVAELAYQADAEARAQRLLVAKAASPQEADRARVDRLAAEQARIIADSEVVRAGEELLHLGIDPARDAETPRDAVPVRAPLAGTVLERLVSPGTAVTSGTPLYVVSDLTRLWAIGEVDEARLSVLRTQQAVTLQVAAYPGDTFNGVVLAIADAVNAETRRVTVRIELPNPSGRLKPQMFASASLESATPRDVVVLPASALQQADGGTVVFVERAPGRFERRRVTAGPPAAGRVEILDGLQPGERVAVTGTFLLKSAALSDGSGQ